MSTKRLTTRLRDPKEWDAVVRDVPIFVDHVMYEVPHDSGTAKLALLPDKQPPAGAKKAFAVTDSDLAEIVKNINDDFDHRDKPIKLRDGHTLPPERREDGQVVYPPQEAQPKIVGYGGRARVGVWNGVKAILTDLHYEKGFGKYANERPERSPEYKPLKKSIPDVAVLSTEPRLAMGTTHVPELQQYGDADSWTVRYEMGVDEIGSVGDPTANPSDPTTLAPENTFNFTPEEIEKIEQIWNYLCTKKPALQALHAQLKDDAAPPNGDTLPPSPGAVSPPAPPGGIPTGGAPESQPYASEDAMTQQEADALRAELAEAKAKIAEHEKKVAEESQKYAESETARFLDKLVNYEHDVADTRSLMLAAPDSATREKIALRVQKFHKLKPGKTADITGGPLAIDDTPESEAYADQEPPMDVMVTVAQKNGLSFSGPGYSQIVDLAKQHMKAARGK